MTNPDLLLMDEPTEGLAPLLVETVQKVIFRLKDTGHTILLVEQNLSMALSVADSVHILSRGRIVHTCAAAELLENEEVKQTYLGVLERADEIIFNDDFNTEEVIDTKIRERGILTIF